MKPESSVGAPWLESVVRVRGQAAACVRFERVGRWGRHGSLRKRALRKCTTQVHSSSHVPPSPPPSDFGFCPSPLFDKFSRCVLLEQVCHHHRVTHRLCAAVVALMCQACVLPLAARQQMQAQMVARVRAASPPQNSTHHPDARRSSDSSLATMRLIVAALVVVSMAAACAAAAPPSETFFNSGSRQVPPPPEM